MQFDKRQQQLTFDSKQEKVIDEWGPEKILQVYDPDTGMKGVLVIDNTSTGPGKGAELGRIPHELGPTCYGVTSALESAIEVAEGLKSLYVSKIQSRVSIH